MTPEEKQEFKQLIREVLAERSSIPTIAFGQCIHEWEVVNQYSVTSGPQTRCRRCGAFMTTTTGVASGQTPVHFTWPNPTGLYSTEN